MSEPIKIDEEKLAFISQYLATNSVITKHEMSNVDDDSDAEDSIASVDEDSAAEDSAKENGDD
jgi:hypothetical protein